MSFGHEESSEQRAEGGDGEQAARGTVLSHPQVKSKSAWYRCAHGSERVETELGAVGMRHFLCCPTPVPCAAWSGHLHYCSENGFLANTYLGDCIYLGGPADRDTQRHIWFSLQHPRPDPPWWTGWAGRFALCPRGGLPREAWKSTCPEPTPAVLS